MDRAHPDGEGRNRLSHREVDVLALTARGLSNREVADELRVSVHAVKFHLASIYRKLGVANRTEAAVVYLTAGADGLAAGDAEAKA
jgi:NarL family two-component system response regulator LiaR